MENRKVELWEQQKGEPEIWYKRFLQFYLLETEYTSSVVVAYANFVASEVRINDKKRLYSQWLKDKTPPDEWFQKAETYKWEARRKAYHRYQQLELLKAEQEELKNLSGMRIKAQKDAIKRVNILNTQFVSNYGDPHHQYDKTSDYMNITRAHAILAEENLKAIDGLAAAAAIETLLNEQEKIQQQQLKLF